MSNTRGRPPEHKGKEVDSLDELEQQAKNRISTDGRAHLSGKLKLEWRDQDPSYHYSWASNSEGSSNGIQDYLESGYEFVRKTTGTQAGEKVIVNSKGCLLYLLRIPVKLHEENMRIQRDKINGTEQMLLDVGDREYAGDSKELGKGSAIKAGYTESPLMNE
tara:strand:- start:1895 stop:2380 length:486 start_codon:yes stop_codon:yes gene_type:complete